MADEQTGGMLALIPDNPAQLALDGGEDPGELHLTLLYLGDDVGEWDAGQADRLRELVTASAPALDAVNARIIGPALFNPDGGPDGDRDPCLVLLVSDAPDLSPLRKWAQWVTSTHEDYPTPPEQFEPYIPHVTVAVDPGGSTDAGVSAQVYTGPVRFGTLRLALAGDVLDVPLGDQEAPVITETKSGEITFTPPADVIEVAAILPGPIARVVTEGKALNSRGVDWVAEHCGEVGVEWATEMRSRAGEIEVKRTSGDGIEVKARDMNMGKRVGGDAPSLESLKDLDDAIGAHKDCPPGERPANIKRLKAAAGRLGAAHHVHQRIGSLETATTDGSGTKSLTDDVEYKHWAPGNSAPTPITNLTHLNAAIREHPKVRDSHKAKHKKHLAAEAARLGAPPDVHAKIGYLEPHSFHDSLKSDGTKDAAQGVEFNDLSTDVEVKIASPDPRAARLRQEWAHNPKLTKLWKPGIKGDFKRLRRHLAKYVHTPKVLNGLTANIHKLATGEWPGKNAHTGKGNIGKALKVATKSLVAWDEIEVKAAPLLDDSAVTALHDGVDDWGQIFDEAYVAGYLAALEEGDDTPDTPNDGPADENSDALLDTARLAGIGARMVVDDAPAGAPVDSGQETGNTSLDQEQLFDPEPVSV